MSQPTLDSTPIGLKNNFTISPQKYGKEKFTISPSKNGKEHFIISPSQIGKYHFTISPSQNEKDHFTTSPHHNGKDHFTISPQKNGKGDPDPNSSLSDSSLKKKKRDKKKSVINIGNMTCQTHHRATILIRPTTVIIDANGVRGRATREIIRSNYAHV